MGDEWIELESGEAEHDLEPVGTAEELDPIGYDPDDDPTSQPLPEEAEADGEAELDDSESEAEAESARRTAFPVAKAAIPAWVQEHGNGGIPLERMVKVAPIVSGYLVPEAAAAWRNLQNAAAAARFALTMTGAYRTYADQTALFQQRYVTSDTGRSSKVWNGTRYWLKPDVAMAAVPGTSNHGWGCAVDAALHGYGASARSLDERFLSWAVGRAGQHGWSWEVQSEPWHLRLVSFAAVVGTPVTDAPEPPRPTLKVGSRGGQVAALQNLCVLFGWGAPGRVDGIFGPRTHEAVKAMQAAVGASVDGEYGPRTAARLRATLAAIAPP